MKYLAHKPLPNDGILIRLCINKEEVIEKVGDPSKDHEVTQLMLSDEEYASLSECTPQELLDVIQYQPPVRKSFCPKDAAPVRIHDRT